MSETQAQTAHTPRAGVWLIGARGSVATTAITGAAAVRSGLASPAGCVTELPDFPNARLPRLSQLVLGGHDVLDTPLSKRAEELAHGGVLPSALPALLRAELKASTGRSLQVCERTTTGRRPTRRTA
ncbi:inositol-3-phosphate synthase [Streptomyces sp. NBC_01320]|uniref:inositol-3-phosphate synthase n=1 Tax=Streptomyces sp. NBC_01320 TaxID=2903824 RepID=UPI003FA3BF99